MHLGFAWPLRIFAIDHSSHLKHGWLLRSYHGSAVIVLEHFTFIFAITLKSNGTLTGLVAYHSVQTEMRWRRCLVSLFPLFVLVCLVYIHTTLVSAPGLPRRQLIMSNKDLQE